jgi:lycopene cyclase domain-containing protein
MNLKKWGLPVLAVLLVVMNWATASVRPNYFVMGVNPFFNLPFFESHLTYLYLHLFAFIPVFLLSFDKKVAFYKSWKFLIPALFLEAAIFIVWDIVKTDFQVWGFNTPYYIALVINLPIEEWFFFLVFPFCSVFIYECLNAYLPNDRFVHLDRFLSLSFGFGFIIIGLLFWSRSYTATTCLPAGIFALWHFLNFKNTYRTRFYRAFLVGLFPFFIVNSVLTGSVTSQPVVFYNPEEYLGIRIGTIPVDDFIYNFLLQFLLIFFFERFRSNSIKNRAF